MWTSKSKITSEFAKGLDWRPREVMWERETETKRQRQSLSENSFQYLFLHFNRLPQCKKRYDYTITVCSIKPTTIASGYLEKLKWGMRMTQEKWIISTVNHIKLFLLWNTNFSKWRNIKVAQLSHWIFSKDLIGGWEEAGRQKQNNKKSITHSLILKKLKWKFFSIKKMR